LIIFIVAVAYGAYVLFFRDSAGQNTEAAQASVIDDTESSRSQSDESHQRVVSLKPVNGYDARGKATITTDEFGTFEIQLSLALPAEFETTYYEAYLKGDREVKLGKLSREGGLYKISYSSDEQLDVFDRIVVIVDGDAQTIEGKTLPHDVMIGQLN